MQQKFYTISFIDGTQEGVLSKTNIQEGAESIFSSPGSSVKGSKLDPVAGQLIGQLSGQMIGQVSSQIGFNLSPAISLGKAIFTGAGAGAVTGAVLGIVSEIGKSIFSAISNKIAELRQEAAEANERDNSLVLAGSLDLYGYTIKKGKWGRDEYVYSRG